MKNLKAMLTAAVFMITALGYAGDLTITGTVTANETGDAIPFASVLIKGQNTGTSTDLDGNYEIKVPGENSVLVFQSVGFIQKEIKVGTKKQHEFERPLSF